MDTYRSDFGRTETDATVSNQFLRRAKSSRKGLFRRNKNGIYDPVTFYHVIDGLLQIKGWHNFQSGEFAAYLRRHQPAILWDAVTVGRVLADIAESLEEQNPLILRRIRKWNGMTYEVSDHKEHRETLMRLMEGMRDLAEQDIAREEADGDFLKRIESPMLRVTF